MTEAVTETEEHIYPPSAAFVKTAHVDGGRYEEMYARSIADPEGFRGEAGKRLDWIRP